MFCSSLIETVGMVTVEIGLETGMIVLQEDLDKVSQITITLYLKSLCFS